MKILVLVAAALGLLFFVSMLSARPGLRRAARLILLLAGIACLGLAIVFFFSPFFSRAEGRFVPMLFSVVPGFISFLLLSFWQSSGEGEAFRRMSVPEQRAVAADRFESTREDIEESLAGKRAKVARSFFLDPRKRARLRRQIQDDERLLRGLGAMEDSYDRYQDRRDAGLPPESGLTRLRRFLTPPDPNRKDQP
jgi:hypothetical protein